MLKGKFGKSTTPAGAFAALAICIACISSPVGAQTAVFIIEHSPAKDGAYKDNKKEFYGETKVWAGMKCDKQVRQSSPTTITCTLNHTPCEVCPFKDTKQCEADRKYCRFLVNSTQRAPMPIIIGQGRYNPDCVYATYWDYTLGQTITISGPCF